METINNIANIFYNKNLKVTPQRVAVYKALGSIGHACVEDVVSEVHKSSPTITVGTIYNVLDCLAQNGIITKLNTSDNKMYFDINTTEHHHMYCPTTHRLQDYEDENFVKLIKEYMNNKQINGFKLQDIKVQLIGEFEK